MRFPKHILVLTLLLAASSSFYSLANSLFLEDRSSQKKVYGARSEKKTTNVDGVVSTNSNNVKIDQDTTVHKAAPIISKAPVDPSAPLVKQVSASNASEISPKPVAAVCPVKSSTVVGSNPLEYKKLKEGDYKASIYFKDGSKRDATILSTSTNNVYDVRFPGEKDSKQINSNTVTRIERKGGGASVLVETSTSPTVNKSGVMDWEAYKASVYFKDGAKMDGTIISENADTIALKIAGGKIIDIKSHEVSKIERK